MRRSFLLFGVVLAVVTFFVTVPLLFLMYELRNFDLSEVNYGYGEENF